MKLDTLDKSLRWYLAGPMSGRPQFNVPTFDRAAAVLRGEGYTIISPAELDSPLMREKALLSKDGYFKELETVTNETWGDVLARDVKVISDQVDGLIFLPYWWMSNGARLEAFVGLLGKKRFAQFFEAGSYDISDDSIRGYDELYPLTVNQVRAIVARAMP